MKQFDPCVQILRRIPREVYGGAVLTALKRSADMSVEEAIEYKVRAGLLNHPGWMAADVS